MNPKKYSKVFAQVSPSQAIELLTYLAFTKVTIKLRHYGELMEVVNSLNEKSTCKRKGNSNVLSIHDDDLGAYSVTLRRGSSDFAVFQQCLIEKQYQPLVELSERYQLQIRNIIDAGANIGCTTLFFGKKFPDAKTVSVEPENGNFQRLRKNVSSNSLENVVLMQAALWYNDDAKLSINNEFGDKRSWAFSVNVQEKPEEQAVESVTVTTILKKYLTDVVDILKIDIEGAEQHLFSEPARYEEWLPKCKMIAIEFHDQETRKRVNDILRHYGFQMTESSELMIGINTNLVALG